MACLTKRKKATILRREEEEEILQFILEKAKNGDEVQRKDVTDIVVKYLKSDMRKNPFRGGVPGDKWFSLFRRRHNHRFKELDSKMLQNIEKAGFTEKVTNTVVYAYNKSPTPIIRRAKPEGILGQRTKKTPSRFIESPTPSSELPQDRMLTMPSPTNSCSSDSASESTTQADSTDFQMNSRLEVMDFNEKWYPVKVVEVDYEEGEVLVHFEKWSDRFDEWVRMDSNRIRRPQPSTQPSSKKRFEENEKVIAVWTYNHKYPATVRKVLSNDKYEVLFSDGYAKVLRGCKLFKATEEDLKNWQIPAPKKPAPPMGADPLDPDLGPKEERRLKKRKLDVFESYMPQKKLRLDTSQSTPESSPHSTSSSVKPKEVVRKRGYHPLLPMKKVDIKVEEEDDDENYDNYIDEGVEDRDQEDEPEQGEEEEEEEEEESTSDVEFSVPVQKQRRRRRGRKGLQKSPWHWRRKKLGIEDDERWNTEIPPGASPVQIKEPEGYYRESLIVPDKKLPAGWTKHTMRRKNGVKWDVFLVNEEGRKFRSRNELRGYFADLEQPFPDENFDFMVSRKIEMTRNETVPSRRKLPPGISFSTKRIMQFSRKKKLLKSLGGEKTDSLKRELKPGGVEVKTERPSSPATPAPVFSLAEFKSPSGGFTCCGKNFRKENLFQMHIKHYHPEFGMFVSMPNVADLAYARTVGEPLEDPFADCKPAVDPLSTPPIRFKVEKDTAPKIKEEILEPAAETVPEEQPAADDDKIKQEESDVNLAAKNAEKPTPEESKENADISDEAEPSASSREVSPEPCEEKVEEPATPVVAEPPPSPVPAPAPVPAPEVLPKTPIMITKYNPPGHKSTVPLTKVTISMTTTTASPATVTSSSELKPSESKPNEFKPSEAKPNESKPSELKPSEPKPSEPKASKPSEPKHTIKTLLPMRPPREPAEPKEAPDTHKSRPKEAELEEEPTKKRGRKRTASESLPKKPKLIKTTTGSLDENPAETKEVPESPASGNNSSRVSRNRSQLPPPLATPDKATVSPDANGSVVEEAAEEKTPVTTGRRKFKRFKTANKTSKKFKAEVESEPVTSESVPVPEEPSACENLRKEEIINCSCGYMEEDGLMIQCDLCLCWQHGLCNNIDKESDVPEKYVCSICQNPPRQRTSMKFLHDQDWLKEGKLPKLFAKNKESSSHQESTLKKSHDLTASLLQLRTVIHSLRVKTHIATKPDHPKLYLWAKSWKGSTSEPKNENEDDKSKQVSGPTPEAAIDETECRLRLLEHVEDYQQQVDDRLTSIQAQIAALESEDPDMASGDVSQTLQMLMRDLGTARQLAAVN